PTTSPRATSKETSSTARTTGPRPKTTGEKCLLRPDTERRGVLLVTSHLLPANAAAELPLAHINERRDGLRAPLEAIAAPGRERASLRQVCKARHGARNGRQRLAAFLENRRLPDPGGRAHQPLGVGVPGV